MNKRITIDMCMNKLAEVADYLEIPMLADYPKYTDAPGNALDIYAYNEPTLCRVVTVDGRNPFGDDVQGYRALYEKLSTIMTTAIIIKNFGTGLTSDYHKSFR